MTNSQKIQIRQSEVRQRLNELSGLEGDDFTAEHRAETEKLSTEYSDLETRFRAATLAEVEAVCPYRSVKAPKVKRSGQLVGKASLFNVFL